MAITAVQIANNICMESKKKNMTKIEKYYFTNRSYGQDEKFHPMGKGKNGIPRTSLEFPHSHRLQKEGSLNSP